MKLSSRARYALHIVCEISRNSVNGQPVRLSEIASEAGTTRKFLEQLAIALRNRRIIRGVSGRSGGYLLGRPAAEITIREVITAAAGPIRITPCSGDPPRCDRSEFCECRPVWLLITARIKAVLDEYTIADIQNDRVARRMKRLVAADGPFRKNGSADAGLTASRSLPFPVRDCCPPRRCPTAQPGARG
ncbi:MAG: Rrf2 family transcriptional regulator [Deltaproteobacteria bacterium]|nr:Rrf2 family transcriptional regulator [Deltaproteobacteria bacterium]